MVQLKPFRGTRPFNEDAKNIIAPSTDYLSEENLENIYNQNYWNYLKILNPVGKLKETETLLAAKKHFNEMKKKEIIKKDKSLSYYVYEITSRNHKQLGFLSLANMEDYLSNKIKGHENTYTKRMQERADQMINIETQIGPIFMSYPKNDDINSFLLSFTKVDPHYDFESFDQTKHKLWCINNEIDIQKITNKLQSIKSLYIADGHHRMGAMNIIAKKFRSEKYNKNDFMIAAFPTDQLQIFDYNRVIRDLNGQSKSEFLKNIKTNFKVTSSPSPYKPVSNKYFGMYLSGEWYSLKFIKNIENKNDILSSLDINIINNYCLIPFLGIKDVNSDERIRFIAGCHGLRALEKKVDENYNSVAFSIFPSQIEDVMSVADNNLTMPPKSTWFDPKPLDGLVVYEFNQENTNEFTNT